MEYKHKYNLGERVCSYNGKEEVIGTVKEIYVNINSSAILYNISDIIWHKNYYYKEEDLRNNKSIILLLLPLMLLKRWKEIFTEKK
ncbi:hypothetical protein [Capnocytophaga bilenii]